MVESLYMETTKKDPEDTMAEIKKLLKKYGMTRFNESYSDGVLCGCIFAIKINGKDQAFSLPINWYPLWERAKKGETKYIKDEEQAMRVAWRQVLRWIESQLALIDIGMADFQEIFLPYAMINSKQTLYQKMLENDFQLLEYQNK
jgi:hypothetical protein